MNSRHLFSIPNNEASWMAIALAIPTYGIVLIGTGPLLQGVFYLVYLMGLIFIWQRRRSLYFSYALMLTTLVFFAAWIIPNLITHASGRIESEALSLPVLMYHVCVLLIVILWQRSWTLNSTHPRRSLQALAKPLLILITPLVILIIAESLRLTFEFPDQRPPNPFNYRHLVGEVFLMFLIASLAVPSRWIKIAAVIASVIGLHLIENRGGLLSVGVMAALYVIPYLLKRLGRRRLMAACVGLVLFSMVFYEHLYQLIDIFFLIENQQRGLGSGFTDRLPIWIEAWHEIQRVPWTGVGFWVSPFPFHDVNPNTAVHNAFLRVWVENGTFLFGVIMGVLIAAAIQIERKKLDVHRAAFFGILVYYFFLPRHLTLNPLSILLYLMIIQALCLPSKKNNDL